MGFKLGLLYVGYAALPLGPLRFKSCSFENFTQYQGELGKKTNQTSPQVEASPDHGWGLHLQPSQVVRKPPSSPAMHTEGKCFIFGAATSAAARSLRLQFSSVEDESAMWHLEQGLTSTEQLVPTAADRR